MSASPRHAAVPAYAGSAFFDNLLRNRWLRVLAVLLAVVLVVELAVYLEKARAAEAREEAVDNTPLTAPDEASARLTAQLRGREVLIEDATTETSQFWAQPDGSTRTEMAASPVRVRKATDDAAADDAAGGEGAWADIDPTLVDGPDGVQPKVAATEVTFSDGGDAALARVTDEPVQVKGKGSAGNKNKNKNKNKGKKAKGAKGDDQDVAVEDDAIALGLDWIRKLPKPELAGSQATYREVSPGVDLTVQALNGGFSHWLTVKERPAKVEPVRLPLPLKNVTLQVAEDGMLRLVDKKGRVRAVAPAPLMWDSRTDPRSGLPAREVPVQVEVQGTKKSQVLVLTPDAEFMNDPATQYPVTIDPTTTLYASAEVIAQSNKSTNQAGATALQAGTYNGGGVKARSLMKFDVAALKGKKINAAQLSMYEIWSSSCTATPVGVHRITSAWNSNTATWSQQPTMASTPYDSVTAAMGYSSACPAGWRRWKGAGMAKLLQEWVDGSKPNYGLALRAGNENDSASWKRWHASNYGGRSVPQISVTYNSYPATGTGRSVRPCHVGCGTQPVQTNAVRPRFTADTTDPDGGNVRHAFQVWAGHDAAPTTQVAGGYSEYVTSGSSVTWSPPADLAPGAYSYRTRAHDGQLHGKWSGYFRFTVDKTGPGAPGVSGALYKNDGGWYGAGGTGDTFTFTPTAATATLTYWLNEGAQTTLTAAGAPLTATVKPATNGTHELFVRARDKAGNSNTTTYAFNVGAGGMVSPVRGDRTARRFALAAKGRAEYTAMRFQYRRGAADGWKDIPAAHVTRADGAAVTWPVAATVAGGTSTVEGLRWDAVATLGGDGAVETRAVLLSATAAPASPAVSVVVDQENSGAAGEDIGPGAVNLLTGDYSISDSDGGPFGLSVSRSTSSRNPKLGEKFAGMVAPFGPQWAVGGIADEDAPYQAVRVTGRTSAQVVLDDASVIEFVRASGTGTSTKWSPEAGSEGLTLTGDGTSGAPFALRDDEDGLTRFRVGNPLHVVQSTTPAASTSANTTRFGFEAVADGGSTKMRLRRILAPTPAVTDLAACDVAAPPKGCRVMELTYAPYTSAEPAAGALGDFPGRVTGLKLWATAPGGAGTVGTVITRYSYDDAGRLREAYDPRATGMKTSYTYDTGNRVQTLTEAGQLPWRFDYANLNLHGDTNPGRLTKVRRATLTPGSADAVNGEALTSVLYNVPMSGAGAPAQMLEGTTKAWGQTGRSVPTDATAIFPADAVPPHHSGGVGVNWTRASVTYLDVNAQETNALEPGGHLDFTAYDEFGNTVRALSAGNRALAVGSSSNTQLVELGLHDDSTADRAIQLSDVDVYDSSGQRLMQSFGPLHLVAVPGSEFPQAGRAHLTNTYDEGRPADALMRNLVTTVKTGARLAGSSSTVDVRTQKAAYDWKLGLQTAGVDDAGGLNITRKSTYDAQGRQVTTSQPKSDGTGAGTMVTRYYTAGAHPDAAACGNRPEWADLVCSVGPAGAIEGSSGGAPARLPASSITYTADGQADVATEISVDGAGATKRRVTNADYDAAGRQIKISVTGDAGAALPVLTTTYDPATGEAATTTATAGTTVTKVSRRTDKLGRDIGYVDSDGATTTTTYDRLDRVTSTKKSDGSTETVAYDHARDPRGMATSMTDSVAGRVDGTYDADGALIEQSLVGVASMRRTFNPAGGLVAQAWSRLNADGSRAGTLLDEQVSMTGHGQWQTHQTRGSARNYAYDKVGRLITAKETYGTGCTVRRYGFDANSNRLFRAQGRGTTCPDPATLTPPASSVYDSADRLMESGYAYDAFGRTTKMPGTEAIEYYVNDLVRTVRKSAADTMSWTLDPILRLRTSTRIVTDAAGVATRTVKVNHYGDDGDSPDWISESDAAGAGVTRYVSGLAGSLLATTARTDGLRVQVTNLHGDVVLDYDPKGTAPEADVVYDFDEYGVPEGSGAKSGRYAWLGGAQRSSETPNGLVLMGVRLYNPNTGRFLQVDPVPDGSPAAYLYPTDPLQMFDLDGRLWGLVVRVAATAIGVRIVTRPLVWGGRDFVKPAINRSLGRASGHGGRAGRRKSGMARPSDRRSKRRSKRRRGCNSFVAGTAVLMADGSSKAIELVRVGDLVMATDPESGETRSEPVIDTIVGSGVKNLVDLVLDADGDGQVERIGVTSEHPFYTVNRNWTHAGDLMPNDRLRTAQASSVVLLALENRRVVNSTVYNLSVANLHTYYVAADPQSAPQSAFLVHNCNRRITGYSIHARERMAKYGWDESDVLEIFYGGLHAGQGNHPGSVRHVKGNAWVVVSSTGKVITVGKIHQGRRRRR